MTEIWKDIEGYQGTYQVSNCGNVRSLDRRLVRSDGRVRTIKGHMMHIFPATKDDVTARVELSKDNKYKSCYVSSLVAAAFLDVPYCSTMIFHIDGNYNNNKVDNLTTDITRTHWYNDKMYLDEEWKDVLGYEGDYQVSSYGRFRTLPRMIYHSTKGYNFRKGVIHEYKDNNETNQYINVQLWKNGNKVQKNLHRLVAEAFIPNPENKPIINHIDGMRRHNWVTNLEWCTFQENSQHAVNTGLNEATGFGKPVKCITNGKIYESISSAANDLHIGHDTVTEALYRKAPYGGYEFEYI